MGFGMKRIAAFAACSAFIAAALAQAPYATMPEAGAAHAEAKLQRVETKRGHAHPGHIRSSHVRAFALLPPLAERKAAEMQPQPKGAPLKVGFGRDVPDLVDANAAAAALQWQRNPDGTLTAALSVTSETASSLRAALRVEQLPANATVRFQAPGEASVFEVSGEEIAAALARNAETGDTSAAARLYWSPLIEGDTLLVEVELPPGVDPLDTAIAVPQVAHLVTSAAKAFEVVSEKSATCEVDVMCSASANTAQKDAVARMLFAEGTSHFLCTGTLLADQDAATSIPYFLSANHCINTQASASSLTTFWFYRSTTCGGATLNPSSQQVAGGATLLYNSSATDTSFMRLNSAPPAGALFAGWFAGATPPINTAVAGLHHPGGDLLKISTGVVDGYINCTPPTNGQFTCSGTQTNPSNTFYLVGWSSGLTEPGSSGSGLFRGDGKLIGQLYGGSATCTTPADDIYGRFDIAFNAALKNWLVGNTLTVTSSGSGTVTSSPAGIDCGATCSATFTTGTSVTLTATPAAGFAFAGWSGACGGTGACVVPMNAAATVNATFVQATIPLNVSTVGNGIVTSTPAGINCGATCSSLFAPNAAVTLNAAPGSGMVFLGWSGACSGTAACTLTLTGATSVGATFGPIPATTTTLASSVNPSAQGQAVSLTATVAGGTAAATGTVTFLADGNFIGGCAGIAVTSGSATCTTASLAPGSHAITASYSGDAAHAASTAAALTQQVTGTAATPPASSLVNLSTRMQVGTGDNVLIAGFIIGGAAPKTVVVTALGPSLVPAGISNPLANPTLTLVRSSDNAIIASNDDWGTAPNAAQIQAAGFAPGNAVESAIMMTLAPGAYTAIVAGAGGGTGVGIVAVYEVDHPEVPLANASTRGLVLTGNDVMIGGFVIQGSAPKTVVVRSSGPSMAPAGVANYLANPTITLVRSSDNSIVATNDDWGTDANAAQLQAIGLQPGDPREPAILVTLPPGAYTAIVSGAGGTTGVATVEIFAQ
jgi:V8-like Glu-specific endopeptidase